MRKHDECKSLLICFHTGMVRHGLYGFRVRLLGYRARWDIECLLAGKAEWPISLSIPILLSGFFPCAICIYLPTFISLLSTIVLSLLLLYL